MNKLNDNQRFLIRHLCEYETLDYQAGRKPIATEEMKTEVRNLRQKGLSCSEIAKSITQSTGKNLSKSTVYKIRARVKTPINPSNPK